MALETLENHEIWICRKSSCSCTIIKYCGFIAKRFFELIRSLGFFTRNHESKGEKSSHLDSCLPQMVTKNYQRK